MSDRPKYVIINDCDRPEPRMVCQWVPGVGYCYLDRSRTLPSHDGMSGEEATRIEDFGLSWADNADGTVSFYATGQPSTATYRDGKPRQWQSMVRSFERRQLPRAALATATPSRGGASDE